MEAIEQKIKVYIGQHLQEAVKNSTGVSIPVEDLIDMVRPAKKGSAGDYQFNVCCLHKWKAMAKGKEADLAKYWANKIKLDLIEKNQQTSCSELINTIETNGKSPFINIFINRAMVISEVIKAVLLAGTDGETYGQQSEIGQGKTVLVEYSSPNIAKPFHMGHLRSTILGQFLKRIYENMGFNVVGINYLGDWGKQYGLLAIAYEKWGDENKLTADPIEHLYELYVRVNAEVKKQEEAIVAAGLNVKEQRAELNLEALRYFQQMETGDEKCLALWKKLKDMSLVFYQKMYNRLGISFDVYSGESEATGNELNEVLDRLEQKGLLEKDEKGVFVDLTKINKQLGRAVMLKSDSTTMYLTRDLAEVYRRWKRWQFHECLYVVGNPQQHHFHQFFKILELLEDSDLNGNNPAGRCRHVGFGKVLGMSTRAGNAIFLSEILDKARDEMKLVMQSNEEKAKLVEDVDHTADVQGISAVMVQDLSAHRDGNYTFDWKRMLSYQGETGPYLQYAHARICSIIRKVCEDEEGCRMTINPEADLNLLVEEEAFNLTKVIGSFPGVLRKCYEELEACMLVEYLMDLAKAIAVAHLKLRVKDMEKPLGEARLLLFWCARATLRRGLEMLGLEPITAM